MPAPNPVSPLRLSLILPTFNEAANLPELLKRIEDVLTGSHDVLVVDDDSPDETWRVAEELKAIYPHLRVLRRVGRRGLSSAVVEGFNASEGATLLVMDSDLQHDPKIIPKLLHAIEEGATVAVASRYMEGGSVGEWVRGRRILSRAATALAQKLPNVTVSDPMSGFFAIQRDAYQSVARRIYPRGFKILLEILSLLPAGTPTAEVPLQFQVRKAGKSKLSLIVHIAFLVQIVHILLRRITSVFQKRQFSIFLLLCAAILLSFALPLWRLHLLYLDSSVRSKARQTLEEVSSSQGWILSDISLRRVSREGIEILHRAHRRGEDSKACFSIPFATHVPAPCENF